MEPSKKSERIEEFLDGVLGKSRRDTIKADRCVACNEPAVTFKDELSRKEYSISGLCQNCQDATFKPDEKD